MKFVAIFIFTLLLYNCNNPISNVSGSDKPRSQTKSKCLYYRDFIDFKKSLFPFEFKKAEFIKDLQKNFQYPVQWDSIKINPESDEQIKKIILTTNNSRLVLLSNLQSQFFYLVEAEIDSRIIPNAEFYVDLPKKYFLDVTKIFVSHCDTITFEEGELSTYYTFIFKAERLYKINVYSTE